MKIQIKVILILLVGLISCKQRVSKSFIPNQNDRKSVEGIVLKISDGDTFTLLFDNGFEVQVRLDGIDCPEKKQAFSKRAKKELSDMIFEKKVTVHYDKKDRYGRVLGDVFIENINVNQEMVKRGMAWHYIKYSDDETLSKLEEDARNNKVGLWAEPNPVPPWEFRGR